MSVWSRELAVVTMPDLKPRVCRQTHDMLTVLYICRGILDQRGLYLNKVLAGNRFMVSDTVLSEARNGNTAIVVSACSTDVSISNSSTNTVESTSSSSVNN